MAVTVSVNVGDFYSGSLTTILIIIGILLQKSEQFQFGLIEIARMWLFIGVSLLISLVVDQAKRIDQAREHKQREKAYMNLITDQQQALTQAQAEIRARDEFLSIASHELKTPLTTMLLQLQRILHNIRNVSLANFSVKNLLKMLEIAELQSQRLAKMIRDLLNISLITTGRLELDLGEVDLSQLVREVVDGFQEKMKRENITATVRLTEGINGRLDKVRLEQALSNLLSNAIKYGNGKPIEVTLEKHNAHARLVVRDQGIGIPKNSRERIFGRFERGINSTNYRGLGVGLYITKQIVTTHQGKISLKSKPGHGSTFTIDLPLNLKT